MLTAGVAPRPPIPLPDAGAMSLLADVIGERPRHGEKGACRIARLIEEDLIAQGWPDGSVYGSEQDVAEAFGAGRAVTREAVRILEVRGTARMVSGPGGGLRVLKLDPAHTTGLLIGFSAFLGLGEGQLQDADRVLDRVRVALVGRRERVDASVDPDAFSRQVDATLALFGVVVRTLLEQAHRGKPTKPAPSILLAPDAGRRSRAAQIAGRMLGECTVEQWVGGYRLGSEEDLCDRYDADRDALRQAVRILESAGAAKTMCGRGHGLVSKAPRAGAIARLVSCMFASDGIDPRAVMLVFEQLSLEIAGLAARRATAADCAEAEACLTLLDEALDSGDADTILGRVFDVEEAILRACRNPLLHLFAQALRGYPSIRIPRDAGALTVMNRHLLHSARPLLAAFRQHDIEGAIAAQQIRVLRLAALSERLMPVQRGQ